MSETLRLQIGDVFFCVECKEWHEINTPEHSMYEILYSNILNPESGYGVSRIARPCNIEDAVECVRCGQEMSILENPKIKKVTKSKKYADCLVLHFAEENLEPFTIRYKTFFELFAPMKLRFIPAVSE